MHCLVVDNAPPQVGGARLLSLLVRHVLRCRLQRLRRNLRRASLQQAPTISGLCLELFFKRDIEQFFGMQMSALCPQGPTNKEPASTRGYNCRALLPHLSHSFLQMGVAMLLQPK